MAKVFNPVKPDKDGLADRVVWSTDSLNIAIEALEAGKRLKANPFYENQIKLLKGDLVFDRTEEEIAEWKKCRDDIIYWANTYAKLMTPKGIRHIELREYQREYLRHLMDNRLSIFLSARQSGKTTTSALFMLHYICFNVDKNSLVLGNKRKTAVEILDKVKKIYEQLPFFLRPGVLKWNESEVVFDNGCRCMAEATTINSGISFTFHCVLADEFAHVPENIVESFYNNLFPTITAARARFMITSTQNGYNLFYRLWSAATAGKSEYKPYLVDWWQIPEWDPVTQAWIERDEAWRQIQIGNLGSEENFNKQYGTMFTATGETLMSQAGIKKLREGATNFVNKDLPGVSCVEHWFWHPDYEPTQDLKQDRLIFTTDLAEGIGKDYTVVLVSRLVGDNIEVVGYFHSNTIYRMDVATSLMNLHIKWCNMDNCLMSVEWNTYGELFIRDVQDINEKHLPTWDQSMLVRYFNDSGTSYRLGIKLTANNKGPHCMLMKESLERGSVVFKSNEFINEILNFNKTGSSYGAMYGHDDLVMATVQIEFVKESLQFTYLLDGYKSDMGVEDVNAFNPYAF